MMRRLTIACNRISKPLRALLTADAGRYVYSVIIED